MEARFFRAACVAAAVLALGASHPTRNFVVTAPTPQLAREIAETAERCRRDLAISWLGRELPPWSEPCPMATTVGPQLGAGGATSFMFDRGRPFGWRMNIQGSRERILDSVVPHEVSHMIFATHFGCPLPRWADEGAATSVEHESERQKQDRLLYTFLTTGRGIAFNRMFTMKEYPRDILPLYSQGYSLARFLIGQRGRREFIRYVGDGMQSGDWPTATKTHYGYKDLSELQLTWVDWVRRGCPPTQPQADSAAATAIAMAAPGRREPPAAPVGGASDGATAPERVAAASPGRLVPVPAAVVPAREIGWYARQRDRVRSAVGSATSSGPPSDTADASGDAYVTRPQPVGRPQQIILEWSRGQGQAGPPTAPAPAGPPSGPSSYYAAPTAETVWR